MKQKTSQSGALIDVFLKGPFECGKHHSLHGHSQTDIVSLGRRESGSRGLGSHDMLIQQNHGLPG